MTWDHHSLKRSVSLHVGQPAQPGKTAEDGSGFVLQIFDYAGPSAYKYLRTWFNVHGLWSKPASYIFPNVVTSGKGKTTQLYFNECVSKKWYERQLDAMLTVLIQRSTPFIRLEPEEQQNCSSQGPPLQWFRIMVVGLPSVH